MTTSLTGRIGGQYSLSLIADNKYRVQGRIMQSLVTIYSGEYELCTKIMDYCCLHDGMAQHAIQQLFIEGDPTAVLELIEAAKVSVEARVRRRVGVTVDIESDVLEGENAVGIVTERLSAACLIAGLSVRLIQSYYAAPRDPNRETDLGRIARERDYLLDFFCETEDGTFTFPDGTSYPCRKRKEAVSPALVRTDPIISRDAVKSAELNTVQLPLRPETPSDV